MKSCFTLSLTSNTILTLIAQSWNKSLLNLMESTNSCLKMSAWLDLLKEQMILLMFCAPNDWQYPTFDKNNNVKIVNSIVLLHCLRFIHVSRNHIVCLLSWSWILVVVEGCCSLYFNKYLSECVYSQFRLCKNYYLVLPYCCMSSHSWLIFDSKVIVLIKITTCLSVTFLMYII